jgi:GxxExxY protein
MPISAKAPVRSISEDAFKEIAYSVTGVAFSVHNEFGNCFSENVYKHEVAERCRGLGLSCDLEFPVCVRFGTFQKEYAVDLLLEGGALFELKAVTALNDKHRAQTLNYLFLLGLQRAKLLNFGPASVEHEFISTTLAPADRRQFSVDDARWRPLSPAGVAFRELILHLLDDWGAFLHLPLYYDAVVHHFGGEDKVVACVPVVCNRQIVAEQRTHLLDLHTAFRITAVGDDLATLEDHLRRFLRHTPLVSMEWLNIHKHKVTFVTLSNDDGYSCLSGNSRIGQEY